MEKKIITKIDATPEEKRNESWNEEKMEKVNEKCDVEMTSTKSIRLDKSILNVPKLHPAHSILLLNNFRSILFIRLQSSFDFLFLFIQACGPVRVRRTRWIFLR